MNRKDDTNISVEKSRIRAEIEAQVQEFLKDGGRINVLGAAESCQYNGAGRLWHEPNESGSRGQALDSISLVTD